MTDMSSKPVKNVSLITVKPSLETYGKQLG